MPTPISGLNATHKLADLKTIDADKAKETLTNLKAQLHTKNGQIKSGVLKLMHTTSDSKEMTFERKGWWQLIARRGSKMKTTAEALGDLLKKAGADEKTNKDFHDYINGRFRPQDKSGANQTHFKIDTKDAVYFIKRALGERADEAPQPAVVDPGNAAERTSEYQLHGIVLGDNLTGQQRKDILSESKQIYGPDDKLANPFTDASNATLISQVEGDWSREVVERLMMPDNPDATAAQKHIQDLTKGHRDGAQFLDSHSRNAKDHVEMFRHGGYRYLPELRQHQKQMDQLNAAARRLYLEFEPKSKLSIEVEHYGQSANNPAKAESDRLETAILQQKEIGTPDVPFLKERKALRLARLKIDQKVYKPNEGICAGITAAWMLSMLQTSEATDPEKFADLFRDNLQHTGAHWQKQGISTGSEAKELKLFENALKDHKMDQSTQRTTIDLKALEGGMNNEAVIDKFVVAAGNENWSGSLGFMRHAIGIGKRQDKWHIMDPNVGLMVYDDKAEWKANLCAYMQLRREEPARGGVNPLSERTPYDVRGVVLVADN